MSIVNLDFSRLPTPKDRQAYEARLARLSGNYGASVKRSAGTLDSLQGKGPLLMHGFRLRHEFIYRQEAPAGDFSDRKVPPRELRPPCTEISSSRGSTLRIYLTALAIAQKTMRAGGHPQWLPIVANTDRPGWTDLVATDAERAGHGLTTLEAKDKRARSVRASFKRLETAELIQFPRSEGKRGDFENYDLLDERGSSGERQLYKVPGSKEPLTTLPSGFIMNSWVHVLEDSELAVLLMVACGKGSLAGPFVSIPAETRLLHYGIGRDPYSRARKTLELFGLLKVEEVRRHRDGKTEGGENHFLHRFELRTDGFDEDALPTVITVLKEQLART
ncbi:hypothetical protein [Arthrobacter sp. Rue61a]|uniref:hypothetical protein n=1 Tax=Arthrobacter sp. Rue61a TaxID=1118963 RepID=UPI00027DF302|nr:hypothetical protein [Arthrobacter sp. Rue61a]AFR31217.1 hypothetical protein ARUE_232p00090 [Arthrobacter sp. Rue61a]